METEKNKIDAASDALKTLTCNNSDANLSKKKIVLQLKKDIVAARAAGKCWQEIVDAIKNAGIDVSCAYLRAVIKEQKRKIVDAKVQKVDAKVQNVATLKAEEKIEPVISVVHDSSRNKIRPDTINL